MIIETENLSKSFGTNLVLDRVNLRVPRGSIFGFLGPNGAGKSTTIRILLGLLKRSSGQATILGKDVWERGPQVREEIGYMPGDVRFNDFWRGRELLHYVSLARGGRGRDEVARLAQRFDLDLKKRIRSYSRGMRQKLGLIQALMHRPQLLILDEPTSSLDPLVQQTLFEELRAVAADGRTVLFSSHTLPEVEQLCDQVAILRDGKLIEHDRVENLRKRSLRRVQITFVDLTGVPSHPPAEFHLGEQRGRVLTGTWNGPIGPLMAWLQPLLIEDLLISEPSLEDLFLGYYSDLPDRSAA